MFDRNSRRCIDNVPRTFLSGASTVESVAMDISLLGPLRRIAGLSFDANGPTIDGTPLLTRSRRKFEPRSREDLGGVLHKQVDATFDSKHMHERLAAIARAMNAGDIALAAIATSQLRVRARPAQDCDPRLGKASADDPKHPGWPAGSADGRGGKFRPHDASAAAATAAAAAAAPIAADRLARIERLQARRGIRAAIMRFINPERLARLGLEIAGEAVPGLEAVDTALLVEDIAEIASGVMENNVEVDAALAFVRQGPRTLEELTMSTEDESFASFADFKKLDLDKQFGGAGDGYEYHHIVEQSSGLSQAELNSTSNIIRIPKYLHEEVNAAYSRFDEDLGMSLRQSLRGASFAEQRAAGVGVLRQLGIIRP